MPLFYAGLPAGKRVPCKRETLAAISATRSFRFEVAGGVVAKNIVSNSVAKQEWLEPVTQGLQSFVQQIFRRSGRGGQKAEELPSRHMAGASAARHSH